MSFSTKSFFLLCLLGTLGLPLGARAQSWQAATALPTVATETSAAGYVKADGSGGYVVAGEFTGTLTLGGFMLTSAGGQDIFVARYNSAGACTQAVRAGGTDYERVGGLAIDANGAVTVAGVFGSPAMVAGATTLTNASGNGQASNDLFVARLSAGGQWTQAARAGGPYDDAMSDLALDPSGTAVVVGSFTGGTISFGARTLTSPSVSGALFLARLNSAGTWTQAVGAQSTGAPFYLSGVALDTNSNAVVCGYYFGRGLTLGGLTLNSSATTTAFVARLTNSGVWTQASQATISRGFAFAGDLALDASGNVVLIGKFREANVSFGPYTLTYTAPTGAGAGPMDNLFVARLNSMGVWTQAAQATGSDNSYPEAVALDAGGNVFIAGQFSSPSITFGSTTLVNANPSAQLPSQDIFLARLSTAGVWNYAISAGGIGNEYASNFVLDGGGAAVTGRFGPAPAAFGSVTVSTPAANAGFIARIGGSPLANVVGTTRLLATSLVPNPANSITTLILSTTIEATAATLLDALGRPVRTYAIPAHATTATLDLTGLPPGLYVVRCGEASGKLVVE